MSTQSKTLKADVKGYWSLDDYKIFETVILNKKQQIMEDFEVLKETLSDGNEGGGFENNTYALHMADQGTDAMEREKTFMFASREGKLLDYLERALIRLQNGTFGYCKVCSNPIDKGRLLAVPHSENCMSCKTAKG